MLHFFLVTLSLCLAVSAGPVRRASFDHQNGQDAIALNEKFKSLTTDSPCTAGENACVGGQFAQCVGGKFTVQACGPGTTCAALPLVNSPGTSITCSTNADISARIAATGATGGAAAPASAAPVNNTNATAASSAAAGTNGANATAASSAAAGANNATSSAASSAAAGANNAAAGAGGDLQKSLTLDPSVIAKGFASDGQAAQDTPEPGQVPSLTSTNNFINFCATVPNLPITNGLQVVDGSCNPAPMGMIPSTKNMPSSKFVFPKNGGTIAANTPFTIQMAIQNIQTGNFVNAKTNYYAAPQQLNQQGIIIGHSHVVVEQLTSLDQTTLTDPSKFAFFKGVNTPAQNGVLSTNVTAGLPAGVYKLSSINAAANHQPVLAAVAQHGSLDDAVYFTVAAGAAGAGAANASATASAAAGAANATGGAAKAAGGAAKAAGGAAKATA